MKKRDQYDNYQTFDEIIKNVKINQRIWQFFVNLTDKESDSLGNVAKSYHKAGYTEGSTSKYRARDLYHSPLIQRLLTLYRKKEQEKRENRELTVFARTDQDLLWALDEAKSRNDYSAVQSIAMNRAKLHGLLIERHQVIDPATEDRIDKSVRLEAARIAERRLLESGDKTDSKDGQEIIEAEIIRPIAAECPTELSNDIDDSAITACIVGGNAA